MVFTQLVMLLRGEALAALGHGLRGPKPKKDLATANQFIDMLQVLKQRTEGNLMPDERALLDATLDEVRRAFGSAINELSSPSHPDRPYSSGFDGEIPGNLA